MSRVSLAALLSGLKGGWYCEWVKAELLKVLVYLWASWEAVDRWLEGWKVAWFTWAVWGLEGLLKLVAEPPKRADTPGELMLFEGPLLWDPRAFPYI